MLDVSFGNDQLLCLLERIFHLFYLWTWLLYLLSSFLLTVVAIIVTIISGGIKKQMTSFLRLMSYGPVHSLGLDSEQANRNGAWHCWKIL